MPLATLLRGVAMSSSENQDDPSTQLHRVWFYLLSSLTLLMASSICIYRQPRQRRTAPEPGPQAMRPETGVIVGENPMHAVLRSGAIGGQQTLIIGGKMLTDAGGAQPGKTTKAASYAAVSIDDSCASSAAPAPQAPLKSSAMAKAGMTLSSSDQSLSSLLQHEHAEAGALPRSPQLRGIPERSPVFDDVPPEPLGDPLDHSIRGLVAQLKHAQQSSSRNLSINSIGAAASTSPSSPPRPPPPLVDPATSSIPTLVADLRAAQLESHRRLVVAAAAKETSKVAKPGKT